MTCTTRTHRHVVAGGRCQWCGEVLQASGPLTAPPDGPGLVWLAAPFLDARATRCRHAPDGCHEPSDATGACAGCGVQLVAVADLEATGGRRVVWFELPTDQTVEPNT